MNIENKISSEILKKGYNGRNKNNSLILPNIQIIDPKWYKITYADYKLGNFNKFNINKINEIPKLKKIKSSLNCIPNNKRYISSFMNKRAKSSQLNTNNNNLNKKEPKLENKKNKLKPLIINNKGIVIENIAKTELNNSIKKTIEVSKEKCIYCLSFAKNPVHLKCTHQICSDCINELITIKNINKEYNKNNESLICLRCLRKINLNELKLKFNIKNSITIPKEKNEEKVECSNCPSSNVLYECLNCDYILCQRCKELHILIPKNQKHKIIKYEIKKNKDIQLCKIHNIEFKYFCLTDNIPICIKCYDVLHQNHNVKNLIEIQKFYEDKIKKEMNKGKSYLDVIDDIIYAFDIRYKALKNEKDTFIDRTKKYFQDISQIIFIHQEIMINQITEFFKEKMRDLAKKTSDLITLKRRFYYFNNFIYKDDNLSEIERNYEKEDINNIQLIKNINYFIKDILKNFPFKDYLTIIETYKYKDNSTFIKVPIKKITHSINKFSFLPLSLSCLENLKKVFKNSNIINENLINSDLLLILPKISNGKLLYRISELGASPELFHEKCDNKGPTIILIKLDSGHIFGAFNSLNYKSKFEYEESDNNFIFSISDGKIRKPIRCKVIKQMKRYALKQSGKENSPGFGISNSADLFIAFKKLNNSYSNLNTVYKCPKGYNPLTFLAGKPNNWNILDIEIYSINYISDEEFFLMNK